MKRILLAITLLLSACNVSTTSPTPVTSQVAADVALIAQGLQPLATDIAAIPGVPEATLAKVNADLALIQQDAALIAKQTTAPAASTVQEIVTTVEALAAAATPVIPGGAAAVVAIDAAASLAAVLMTELGAQGAVMAQAPHAAYSPGQARTILAGSAARVPAPAWYEKL